MRAFSRLPRSGRRLHQVLLPAVFVLLALCSNSIADSSISPSNVKVDTRLYLAGEVSVTMHRVPGALLKNDGPGSSIDDPLEISPNIHGNIADCPELPLSDYFLRLVDSGLVADGVTPLLFRVAANSSLTEPVAYDVDLAVDKNKAGCEADLNGKIRVLVDGAWRQTRRFTLSPTVPYAYLMLDPVRSRDIESNAGGMVNVIMTIRRENASSNLLPSSQKAFGVRKPPVVLVHGYNSSSFGWSDSFKKEIKLDRGDDFVVAIDYGQEDDEHIHSDFLRLARLLDESLREQFEEATSFGWDSRAWAWTRYDVVGHSQGGVLLRLLCSDSGPAELGEAVWKFRSPENYYRGRFRRVITLGAPHFGSSLNDLGLALVNNIEEIPYEEDIVFWKDGKVINKIESLLHRKFNISWSQTPLNPWFYLKTVHQAFSCDPATRMHMVGTVIFGGKTWAENWNDIPGMYNLLFLHRNPDWGESTAPFGSDGVVDLRSQLAISSEFHDTMEMRSKLVNDIAHAPAIMSNKDLWDTTEKQMISQWTGRHVVEKLNSIDPVDFGAFPNFDESSAIYTSMENTAATIINIVSQLFSEIALTDESNFAFSDSQVLTSSKTQRVFTSDHSTNYPPDVLEFNLTPHSAEPQIGGASWNVNLYGPDGVSTQGLSLTTSGPLDEHLRIGIAEGVIGQIILSVDYVGTNNITIRGLPASVWSRFPGSLHAVTLDPPTISLPEGTTFSFDLFGEFDSGTNMMLYTDTNNTSYAISDAAVASVDSSGQVTCLGAGTAIVYAVYQNIHTAAASIRVLQPSPVITSPAIELGDVGEAFIYNITSDPEVLTYGAAGLPFDFWLDSAIGVITGTPLAEGIFHFEIKAYNQDGTHGRQTVKLTVTGTNVAPESIGLDVNSVPALQPAGSEVGRLATVDANTLDTHTYSLVAGAGDTDNALFEVNGNILLTAARIDPVVTPACSLRLRSTDSAGLSFEKAFVLPVAGAPVIIEEPGDTRGYTGRPFTLAVKVSGREPLSFQWQAAGIDLPSEHGAELRQTAGAPGTNTYRVLVGNALGTVTSAVVVVMVDPLSFGAWAAPHADPSGPAIEPDGDINDDGVANWYDFAFGLAPTQTVKALPQIRMTTEGPVFIHRRARHTIPLNYDIRTRPDLGGGDWSLFTPPPETVTVNPVDEGSEEIEVRLPAQDRIFLKLEVTP